MKLWLEPSARLIQGLQVLGGVPPVSLGWMLSMACCCVMASPAAEQCAFALLPPAHSHLVMTTKPGEKSNGNSALTSVSDCGESWLCKYISWWQSRGSLPILPLKSLITQFHLLCAVFLLTYHFSFRKLSQCWKVCSLQCEVTPLLTCLDSHLASAK